MNNLAITHQQNQMRAFSQEEIRLTADQVVSQVNLIKDIVEHVMVEGQHYGKIPGTDKPTLLKPGAEKLCLTFKLSPDYNVTKLDLEYGHREYLVSCSLVHMTTGICYGKGSGICTSMESKYRYRKELEFIVTDTPVPKTWWDTKDINLIGGKGFAVKKVDEVWRVVKLSGTGKKQENPDIADTYNTVLKMAMKRAYVAATLSATCASDLFTQDVEDLTNLDKKSKAEKSSKDNDYKKNSNNKTTTAADSNKGVSGLFNKAKSIIANAKNMNELKKVSTYANALTDDQKGELTKLYEKKVIELKKEFDDKNKNSQEDADIIDIKPNDIESSDDFVSDYDNAEFKTNGADK